MQHDSPPYPPARAILGPVMPEDGDQVLAEALFAFADGGDDHADGRMLEAAVRAQALDRTLVRLGRTLATHRARWLGVVLTMGAMATGAIFWLSLGALH